MIKDIVFRREGVWFCLVNGKTYGAWACKEYAIAGMKVEQRRATQQRYHVVEQIIKAHAL